MAITYGTALITGAAIVTYTGVQDLANLATDAELVLNDMATTATNVVYRKLQARGIDPTLITNQTHLYDAVAFIAVYRLALAGYLPGVDLAAMKAEAEDALAGFRPVYASADSPRHGNEGIPAVGHVTGGLVFSGDMPIADTDYFTDDTPTVQ